MLTPLLITLATVATLATLAADPATQPAPAPEIVREAPLPEGWPEPDASGEPVLKRLPTYRMAVTVTDDAQGGGMGGPFGTLFRHIQNNDIAMTAPVEMTMRRDTPATQPDDQPDSAADPNADTGPLRMTAMAFLYRSPDQGRESEQEELEADVEPGDVGEVRVVDVPAMTVLSIGFFGSPRPQTLDAMEQRLRAALENSDASAEYEAAGDPRLLGYNSPFIRPDRRFHELQIPLRELKPANATTAQKEPRTP